MYEKTKTIKNLVAKKDFTSCESESLCQGGRLLLRLLLSLTAAAGAQYLHHVPVDPVSPGQGVPVHLNTAQ